MARYHRCYYDTLEPTPEPYPEELQISERSDRRKVRTVVEERRIWKRWELDALSEDQYRSLGPLTVIEIVPNEIAFTEIRYVANGDKRVPEGLQAGDVSHIRLAYEVWDE